MVGKLHAGQVTSSLQSPTYMQKFVEHTQPCGNDEHLTDHDLLKLLILLLMGCLSGEIPEFV